MYISIYDADSYFNTRFNSNLWNGVNDTDKTKLLTTATRMIDTLNYAGDKADEDQEFEFPRGDDIVVPISIKYACCEIAYALLSGYDPEYELRNLSNTVSSFDQARIQNNDKSLHEARTNGIPSTIAWDLLRPFLRDGSTITLSRVD